MDRVFLSSGYVPYAAWALLFLTFVLPCRLRLLGKVLLAIFFAAAMMMFRGFALFGECMWRPELPQLLIWSWCVAYFGSLVLAVASTLCLFLRFRGKFVFLSVFSFGLSAVGVWNGLRLPSVREIDIRDGRLPEALDGYRIALVSDIHACGAARRWRTEGIVRAVNDGKVDLVCLAGDQTDGTVARRYVDIEPLAGLRARDGVYAVTGNHEHFYDMAEWRPVYRRLGIRLLENAGAFPRQGLALGGVNAFNAPGGEAPDAGRAFAAATNGEYRVLLQHRPNPTAENFQKHHVNLQLSGHTHGGFMPVLASLIEQGHGGYLRGVYPLEGGHLVVSPGCGPWPALPLRYFDPAEILVITLRK